MHILVDLENPALAQQIFTILGVREHTFHFRSAWISLGNGKSIMEGERLNLGSLYNLYIIRPIKLFLQSKRGVSIFPMAGPGCKTYYATGVLCMLCDACALCALTVSCVHRCQLSTNGAS